MLPLLAAAAPIIGAGISALSNANAGEKNAAAQREFAQNGIQWKVADSIKAGVNPIYGLGAQTTSFSPSYVGSNAFANAGQDVSRAMMATANAPERSAVNALTLERAHLENDLLRAQILKTNASIGPPMPMAGTDTFVPGQGDSGSPGVATTPMTRQASYAGSPYAEAGSVAEVGYGNSTTGFPVMMSKDAKERLEEDIPGVLGWNVRNRLLPSFGFNNTPPPGVKLMPGYSWLFNPVKQEYQAVPTGAQWHDPKMFQRIMKGGR